jgi:hypothetical protein
VAAEGATGMGLQDSSLCPVQRVHEECSTQMILNMLQSFLMHQTFVSKLASWVGF